MANNPHPVVASRPVPASVISTGAATTVQLVPAVQATIGIPAETYAKPGASKRELQLDSPLQNRNRPGRNPEEDRAEKRCGIDEELVRAYLSYYGPRRTPAQAAHRRDRIALQAVVFMNLFMQASAHLLTGYPESRTGRTADERHQGQIRTPTESRAYRVNYTRVKEIELDLHAKERWTAAVTLFDGLYTKLSIGEAWFGPRLSSAMPLVLLDWNGSSASILRGRGLARVIFTDPLAMQVAGGGR
ncbi:MAG: hypothetical protein M1826_003897, partial [Phylliscum demangeonii]